MGLYLLQASLQALRDKQVSASPLLYQPPKCVIGLFPIFVFAYSYQTHYVCEYRFLFLVFIFLIHLGVVSNCIQITNVFLIPISL